MASRKHYKQEQMMNAIEAVRNGQTVSGAAKRFGVPRITLRNKIIGKSPLVCGMGPPSILTNKQEKMFAAWVHKMSDKHIPVGKEHLLDSVEYFVTEENIVNPFKLNRPGKKWYNSFTKRNPDVSTRISENWWKSKDNITEQKIRSWFTNINKYLKKKGLLHIIKDARRIFTSDEASFYLNPKHERALVKRNETNIYSVAGNEKEHPKVFITANAAGELAPPMVVFPNQGSPANIPDNIPEEWGVGISKIGWMSADTLYGYITNVFHSWLIKNDIKLPVIYFLDGEATHLTRHLSEFCEENQIELLSLYPNSNHILKTIDVAIFRPLKAFWKRQCTMWEIKNINQQIKKDNFAPILESAIYNITSDCIRNGFKISGLFPFTAKNIDFTKLTSFNRTKSHNTFQFLNTLEKEIVLHFSHEKLEAFNTLFNTEKDIVENDLPEEDISLYTIWTKYKHACQNSSISLDETTLDISIPKSINLPSPCNPKNKISNNETYVKIRRSSSENENNAEGDDSDDCKPLYLHLRRDSSDTSPSKQLPSTSTSTRRLNSNKTSLKHRLWFDNGSKAPKRTKNPATLTTKTLQQLNKRHLEKKAILKQAIKQEPIDTEDLEEDYTQKPKRRKKISNKRRKILISYEDGTETERSGAQYFSEEDEVTDKKDLPDIKDIIDKKFMSETKEQLGNPVTSVDLLNEKNDDDNVIICVTDDGIKILYN